jgi:hypothetical protein
MIILKEEIKKLDEMAKIVNPRMIPDQLEKRAKGAVHDGWFWNKSMEDEKEPRRIGLQYSLSVSTKENLDFYYGFIRPYPYRPGGSAKASGAPSNPKWVFCALRLESNISGAEGKWSRIDFKDEDFEILWKYENKIPSVDANVVQHIVRSLKLKSSPGGNILNLCNDALNALSAKR